MIKFNGLNLKDLKITDALASVVNGKKIAVGSEIIWEKNASPLPSGYRQVEYLQSTLNGGQYINTGITPVDGFGFWIDCMVLAEISTSAASSKILGSSKFESGYWGGVMIATYPTTPNGQMTWMKTSLPLYNPFLVSQQRIQLQNINNHYSSSTGADYDTPIVTEERIYGSLYLFTIHTDRQISSEGTRIYGCKLYLNTDELVRDFIPCLDNNDRPCMFDLVTRQTFYNQGTGEFLYGNII